MKLNTTTIFGNIFDCLLLPALLVLGRRRREALKTSSTGLPAGSVAPLY
jgi:hypothetical protein